MSLSPIEKRVCEDLAGRHEALLADLRLHVELPTGGRNVPALDESRTRLVERAEALGATLQLVPGEPKPDWLFGESREVAPLPTAICRRSGVGREVLVAGHLDTVHDPAGPFQKLNVAADGRTAIGPGCVDMKGGLVIALAALEALHRAGVHARWTLLLNSDEETGSYHSFRAIFDEAARVHAAGGIGIALEPAAAGGALVIERAGSGQFMFEARGKAAHVGRDFASGVNALERVCHAVIAAQQLSDPAAGVIVNMSPIAGGLATNVVPDLARAWGNVRFPTPEAAAAMEVKLREVARRVSLPGSGSGPGSVVVRTSFGRPAKPMTEGTKQLAEMVGACAEALGQKLPLTKTAGVCDGNIMQAAGLATLDTLGVRGGGLHTLEEWIELDSLVERSQLLALTIMRAGTMHD